MKRFDVFVGFLMGAAVGSAASFYILKKKYEKLMEDDHEQFRKDLENPEIAKFFYESALKKKDAVRNASDEKEDDIPKPFKQDKDKTKERVDYTRFYKKPIDEQITEQEDNVAYELTGDPSAVPVIITPEEFGDDDTYAKVSLLYTTDGVLIDENDEKFESYDAICPDYEEHFDEYEDDVVFIRNDRIRCYYEILKSLKSYEEILEGSRKREEDANTDE